MYDYGARMLMPDLGRWGAMDAMSEKYSAWSPYNYAINNPVMVIDPDGNDISYSGEAAQQAFKDYVATMSTSSETSGGNIFTGFASNLFGDDYILNRNGKFERISETKYNFDRLYNWDKSKVIKLNKEFMKNLHQDMKYDSYSNQYKPTETTITFENSSVSTKQIKNYFYFLAANTEKEWGFNHLTKNGWFSDSSVTIINSNHQDDEVSLSPIFRYLDSGYDLIGSGHSHQMLIYEHPENKHLLKGRYEAINYPSRFNSDGSVRYELNKGDRASHETLLQNYGNQIKAYPWIYIGNKDNRPHFIYYDTTSFRRK